MSNEVPKLFPREIQPTVYAHLCSFLGTVKPKQEYIKTYIYIYILNLLPSKDNVLVHTCEQLRNLDVRTILTMAEQSCLEH